MKSLGNRTQLYARIQYAGDERQFIESTSRAIATMSTVDGIFRDLSFNKLNVTTTVIPLVLYLPGTEDSYWSGGDWMPFHTAARQAIDNAGYNRGNYDYVFFSTMGSGGFGSYGGGYGM